MASEATLREFEFFKDKDLTHAYDYLTNILNREAMIEYAEWLVANKRPFSLFLIDIDNFKNVNDTYGHLVGDIVIAQTAQYFVQRVGERGVVARFGGDEFMVIFENVTEYKDVWNYGHEIDMRIGGIEFEGIPNLAITVSMGIARCPLDADSYESLMELADKALYRAKMKGRNCFIIYLAEKHANISLKKEREKCLTSMQQCFNIFSSLTAYGEDISLAISSVFKSLICYYMFDHICLETPKKMSHSVVFTLSRQKQFKHIPYDLIDSLMNSAGYVCYSNTQTLNDSFARAIDEYKKQKICSTMYCKISAYGVDYGFIRVDTASTVRIWQNAEVTMVMMAANTIGLLLHYQHKTLDDLPQVAPVEAGSLE